MEYHRSCRRQRRSRSNSGVQLSAPTYKHHEGSYFLASAYQGKVIGLGSFYLDSTKNTFHISNIFGKPNALGLGTGTAILAAMGSLSENYPTYHATLCPTDGEFGSVGFYEKFGFKESEDLIYLKLSCESLAKIGHKYKLQT